MRILVTGTAGFIGYHLTRSLVERGDEVVGLDSINDYYDPSLKHERLRQLGIDAVEATEGELLASSTRGNLSFVRLCLENSDAVLSLFRDQQFDAVCSLAAQAGVRYSLTNPTAYVRSNIDGFLSILEAARHYPVEHLVYASSSSVYGLDTVLPFSESTAADHPVSLYAVSKRSNELMAHSYSHLYGIPTTGLRFFTVYGPWGRPDMALFLFTRAILRGEPIDVYNHGEMQRDFTYIDDIVEGIVRVIDKPATGVSWDGAISGVSPASARVYNIGNGNPVKLMDFIHAIEQKLGRRARKNMMPMQPGDVPATWADCTSLQAATGYRPSTDIRTGVDRFIDWYRDYYGV